MVVRGFEPGLLPAEGADWLEGTAFGRPESADFGSSWRPPELPESGLVAGVSDDVVVSLELPLESSLVVVDSLTVEPSGLVCWMFCVSVTLPLPSLSWVVLMVSVVPSEVW